MSKLTYTNSAHDDERRRQRGERRARRKQELPHDLPDFNEDGELCHPHNVGGHDNEFEEDDE